MWGSFTSTSQAPFPVVFLCDLAVMYVIGFWLNKNLKLHTYCASAKPAFTAIGAGATWLSWLPTFGIPPLVPRRLLKEEDNRIRSGLQGKHWLSYFAGSCKEVGKCATGHKLQGDPGSILARRGDTVMQAESEGTDPQESTLMPFAIFFLKPHSGTLTLYHLWS